MDTVALSFGRLNPPTIGHELLVDTLKKEAVKNKATPMLYLSHTKDKKKNPLSYNDKFKYAKKAFGNVVIKSNSKTIIQILKELNDKFTKVIFIVGSDRVSEFDRLLNKYNGKEYNFESIEVKSAGDRDPDSDNVSGMSASKIRAAAAVGDQDTFFRGLPKGLSDSDKESAWNDIRKGMVIKESVELEELYVTENSTAALKKKAEKSKMPIGVLRKVYQRGVAAWQDSHRPGTTPQQWGMARVNSFVSKSSGTWGKADKDLADKVRGSK